MEDTTVRHYFFNIGRLTVMYSYNDEAPGGMDYWWVEVGGIKTWGPFETVDKAMMHYQFMYRIGKQEDVLDKQKKTAIIIEERPNNAIFVDFANKRRIK